VPGTLSVISIDNGASAFNNQLTTVDFRMPTIAHRLLMFILTAPKHGHAEPAGPVEVEGVVIERRTTGRAIVAKK
jgi:DNA-binding LacI/PurR family transcriptional regulator